MEIKVAVGLKREIDLVQAWAIGHSWNGCVKMDADTPEAVVVSNDRFKYGLRKSPMCKGHPQIVTEQAEALTATLGSPRRCNSPYERENNSPRSCSWFITAAPDRPLEAPEAHDVYKTCDGRIPPFDISEEVFKLHVGNE